MSKKNHQAMGKFSVLPRGSIKRSFYSVNQFTVEARAYRKGSHATWQGVEMKYSSHRQKGCAAPRKALLAPWAAVGARQCHGDSTKKAKPSNYLGCRCSTFLTEGNIRNTEQASWHTGCAKERVKGIARFFSSPREYREETILQEG